MSVNSRSEASISHPRTVRELIAGWADATPDTVAIEALGREGLTYRHLLAHIDKTCAALRDAGVARNDRVAVVLPNGPEMATAFLAVASAATCAPLNPAYRAGEFDFYLGDLAAKALIVNAGAASAAREAAAARGIPIIELKPRDDGPAGAFQLDVRRKAARAADGFAEGSDVALVLHTSGTTSRPKMVPLTHANLSISARNVARALALTASDRCLNIMPLFHIHGMVGALLPSLAAGATVICTPGFLAPSFMDWLEESRPSWYTAVPTMHRSILSRALSRRDLIVRRPLRFIRSCSAALPPKLMEELEHAFGAPVVESYGMTEASHQMTSNPLPPRARKPGSVGIAAGPEVAIMDAGGLLIAARDKGEIVIRGPNVTNGYENNPEANKSAFTNGWFRTGDEGYLDDDGYLFITGRLKELINRGGEKISPREVDEALLEHPAIAQAIAFAIPDASLGEDVAAAVVLRDGASATEREIKEFAAARLADFKVPRKIVFLDDLPKGPTGKLQRIGLAERLGLKAVETRTGAKPEYLAPRTNVEEALARIWAGELKVERVGVRDDFFDLGGDSMLAARTFETIAKALEKRLPLTVLYEAPTVEKLAAFLADDARSQSLRPIVAIEKGGGKPPFFCMTSWDAYIFTQLARLLGGEQPFYGLHPQGLIPLEKPRVDIAAVASRYLEYIQAVQPHGPYLLGGECSSGYVAYEIAQLLRSRGEEVALLVLFDTPGPWGLAERVGPLKRRIFRMADHLYDHVRNVRRLAPKDRAAYAANVLRRYRARLLPFPAYRVAARAQPAYLVMGTAFMRARTYYYPKPYDGRILMFVTPEYRRMPGSGAVLRWRNYALGGSEVHEIDCAHSELLREPNVRQIAEVLLRNIEAACGADE